MKSNVMGAAVVVLALATAGCGGSEPDQGTTDTVDTAVSVPVEPAPVEEAGASEVVAAAVGPAITKPASFAQCAVCHMTEEGKPSTLGPNLFGIVGRAAGATEGFNYSQAMKESGVIWNAEKLDAFITTPQKVVPGTRMAFGGVADAAKRKEIVDYLTSLK